VRLRVARRCCHRIEIPRLFAMSVFAACQEIGLRLISDKLEGLDSEGPRASPGGAPAEKFSESRTIVVSPPPPRWLKLPCAGYRWRRLPHGRWEGADALRQRLSSRVPAAPGPSASTCTDRRGERRSMPGWIAAAAWGRLRRAASGAWSHRGTQSAVPALVRPRHLLPVQRGC
jgi:hypothetical protein